MQMGKKQSKERAGNFYSKRLNKQPERMLKNNKVFNIDGMSLSKIDEQNEDENTHS